MPKPIRAQDFLNGSKNKVKTETKRKSQVPYSILINHFAQLIETTLKNRQWKLGSQAGQVNIRQIFYIISIFLEVLKDVVEKPNALKDFSSTVCVRFALFYSHFKEGYPSEAKTSRRQSQKLL